MEEDTVDRARLLDRYSQALNHIEKNLRDTKRTDDDPKKPFASGRKTEEAPDDAVDRDGEKVCDCPCRIQTSTIKFKAFFFLFKGSKACIVPFLPVYFQQLGLVASQIGLLQSCSPFTQIPLMMTITLLADRMNIRKTLIVISLIGWILVISCIALVPAPVEEPCNVTVSRLQRYLPDVNASGCPVDDPTGAEAYNGTVPTTEWTTFEYGPLSTTYAAGVSPTQNLTSSAEPPTQQQLNVSKDIIYAPLKQNVPGSRRSVPHRSVSPKKWGHALFAMSHLHRGSSSEKAITLTEYDWLYKPADLKYVYMILLLLSIIGSIFQGPVHALSNAAVLDSLYHQGNTCDYGYQKAFGPVGAAIGTLCMGAYLSTREHATVMLGVEIPHTDYNVAFIAFLITLLLAIPLVFTFDATPKPSNTSEFSCKVLARVICSAKYGSFLLASAWTGVTSGLSTSFLFWYIMSVGGSHVIMGVVGLAALGAETITYFALPQLSRVTSYHTLMLVCLLLVVVRYFIYGIVHNPWWLVVPECFKGVSAAIVEYTLGAIFADESLVSYSCTLQGTFLLAYYAVGFGTGSILGGVVIDYLGAVRCFFLVSIVSLVLSLLFLVLRFIRYGYEKLQEP